MVDALGCISDALLLVCMAVANGLLIYRCYTMWQRNMRIIALPLIMLFARAALQFSVVVLEAQMTVIWAHLPLPESSMPQNLTEIVAIAARLSTARIYLFLVLHILVTGLIVSRILWITHELQSVLGRRATQKYNSVVSIMIESGALICASSVLWLVLTQDLGNSVMEVGSGYGVNQTLGIASTLIAVRVGLERGVEHTLFNQSEMLHGFDPASRTMDVCPNPDQNIGQRVESQVEKAEHLADSIST